MTDDLRRVVDNAYEVFARYPVPDGLGLSGNFQLRDLSLERWLRLNEERDMGVLMYSDSGEMLRYFLPRWLDWLSEDFDTFDYHEWQWNLEGLSYRLNSARWHDWPADQVAALRAVFEVWAREEIAENNGAPPTSWLPECVHKGESEAMGLAGFSVYSEVLDFLAGIGEAPLYLELWLDTNLSQLARWLWIEDFHRYKTERQWVASSRLKTSLETAFFANPDGPNAELFSRSVELIRSLRAL